MSWRSLLSIADITDGETDALLDSAARFKARIAGGGFKAATLKGTSTLLLFYEASTRTRVSFELAGKLLGSDTINISAKGSSAEKGEGLRDTAMTLGAMQFTVVILRHESAGAPQLFQQHFDGPVLNAGAGRGEHPTQALLDAFTLREAGMLGARRRIVIVGDIRNSRVMRSGMALLARRGMNVTLVGPPSMLPAEWAAADCGHSTGSGTGGQVSYCPDLDEALAGADAVMMLRMQRERMDGAEVTSLDEYSRLYGLNRRRLGILPQSAVIMHPGPVNRGVEVSEDVFRDPRCRINDQVTAGLAVRCALLCWALGREPEV